jgi:two-component system, NarL family, nitrate/nitrite response regulator NarL
VRGGMDRVRVFVADDHPLYREGLNRAIKERPDLELVGEAADGREALGRMRELEPDVAVIDVRMPGLDGVAVTLALSRETPRTRVLLLSALTDSAIVHEGIAAGAAAYVAKTADRRRICETIARVARGDVVLADEVQPGLAREIRIRREPRRPILTRREREVLTLVANGASSIEIARQLVLSPATVKTHLQNLYDKLDVSDRAAAVAEAMRRGILD